MPSNIFGWSSNRDPITGKLLKPTTKKRRNVSTTEKTILWERNKSHICHVCHGKIHSLTEAQVDHVRANSKGGDRVSWAHSSCNRMKGNKPLSVIHRRLGIKKKTSSRRKVASRRKPITYDIFGNPIKKQKKPNSIFNLGF